MKKITLTVVAVLIAVAAFCQSKSNSTGGKWSGYAVNVVTTNGVVHVECRPDRHICVQWFYGSPTMNRATIFEDKGKETKIEYSTSKETSMPDGGTAIDFMDAKVIK